MPQNEKKPRHALAAGCYRIELRGEQIEFALRRSANRRTIGLKVDHNGLAVSAPLRSSERYIRQTIQEQAAWILRKLVAWSQYTQPAMAWNDGEELPYLGRMIRLNLLHGQRAFGEPWLDLAGLNLACAAPAQADEVKRRVIEWFRGEARRYLPARIAALSLGLGMPSPRFFLSNADSRWGSCSAKGDVRLSWRLMKAAPHVIDYVAAHELAHLKHMDHSPAFWRAVAAIYPGYESARKELLAHDALYRTF
jgi:predicted metal-dependent hydrolase